MHIFALKGFKVIVTETSAKNGLSYHREQVSRHLEIGKEYIVEKTEVHESNTDVWLQEFPDIIFNSSNFEDVSEQCENEDQRHPDWGDRTGKILGGDEDGQNRPGG